VFVIKSSLCLTRMTAHSSEPVAVTGQIEVPDAGGSLNRDGMTFWPVITGEALDSRLRGNPEGNP
jgi:hypothetical protein